MLFQADEEWRKEWVGMPEFVQERQRPHRQLIVRFATEEDYQKFAALVEQSLTSRTKSIWYPTLVRGIHGGKRWVRK